MRNGGLYRCSSQAHRDSPPNIIQEIKNKIKKEEKNKPLSLIHEVKNDDRNIISLSVIYIWSNLYLERRGSIICLLSMEIINDENYPIIRQLSDR